MKFSRSRILAVAGLVAAALAARADLPRWFQDIRSATRYDGVFMTTAQMPSGPVTVRRTPQETREALSRLIASAPNDAALYALRAQSEEEQLDAAAAESDWLQHAKLAADAGEGYRALAGFYHRRLRPADEVKALETAAEAPNPAAEKLLPSTAQRAWQTFERIIDLTSEQSLPADAEYRRWAKRYPAEPAVLRRFLDYLVAGKRFAEAESVAVEYEKAFPNDGVFPISARARIEQRRGSNDQALAVYDKAFQPLWPAELVKDYFALLTSTHNLRNYLAKARAAQAANPGDLNAAARIFYYYQQQANLPAAQRVLLEFRQRKENQHTNWTAAELWTIARLLEAVHSYDEAARSDHALYSLQGASQADQERALASLVHLLFAAPEQPIRFGANDLSYYKDIATMDPHPGFLNGILSLVLNSTDPKWKYSSQEQTAVAYFHRARAAELLAFFDGKFPASALRPELHAQLIEAYALYGDGDGVIRQGRGFLANFVKAQERTAVALRMAEAFARKAQTQDEFAIYDLLLKELAERADGVPLGDRSTAPRAARQRTESDTEQSDSSEATTPTSADRSPDYARVLDRYISRLVSAKKPLEALRLLRRELDRNPNDPGLYLRLAGFLEQNRLEADIEQVYQRALQQFSTMAWYDKLGRWYVRRKQTAQLDALTRQAIDTFAGTELETYMNQVPVRGSVTPAMYLTVNLYAHERFPHNLAFVRHLMAAYSTKATADPAARERLLRNYWFYADDLRAQYFGLLSSSGRLNAELAGAQPSTPAARRFVAESQAWRSHFEEAVEPLEAVAEAFPADPALAQRAASLDRSLAAFDPKFTDHAVAIAERQHRFDPRNREVLTQAGEILADREQFAKAKTWWDKIPSTTPGNSDGYLEAATVYWDYFQFDDALRMIETGRKKTGNPALFAYEAGAIHESKNDYPRAIAEYFSGAAPGNSSQSRLVTLAKRPAHQAAIDKASAARVAGADPDMAAIALRIAILDASNRRNEVEPLLAGVASRATSTDLLASIRAQAEERGLDGVSQKTLEREAAVTADPIERMRTRLALVRFYEARQNVTAARQIVDQLYRDNPAILGVVRATVDFYTRNKMPQQAIETLARAAAASNSGYRKQFTLEAAHKATESGDYARARGFAEALLKDDPFNSEYVSAMASIYGRQGDDTGLRAFFEDRIKALRTAAFSVDERTMRAASLRRNLIPVLTRQKDYAAGVDQYIELLRAYAEDESLAREAALYADSHAARERLAAYFTKAAGDSPRDFRWPMVLARIDTAFEDLPAAAAAYTKASSIRPDRVDLHIARAAIEERLLKFDDALKSYTKLYDLTYHNPQWMQKVAELHARRGEREPAVKALRTAFLEGRPERPQPFFEIARILEGWNLLPEARQFAERGLALAGNNALGAYSGGTNLYARIMTRLRAHEVAFERLKALRTDDDHRIRGPLEAMGETVAQYFTPEEKSGLEAFLAKEKATLPAEEALGLITAANMTALEAKWRFEILMSKPNDRSYVSPLIELQQKRLKNDELGVQLEAYWQICTDKESRDWLLDQAARAFRTAGNSGAELKVLTLYRQRTGLSGQQLSRYLELLAMQAPERLVAEAAGTGHFDYRNDAISTAMATGKAKLALDAIRARGRSMPPVWTRAYLGMASVYFATPDPAIETEFAAALGDNTVAGQLGKRADRAQQLAGEQWFYYGTVFGEYRAMAKSGDPEDYLPALLEGTPARAAAYSMLGDYYRDTRAFDRALADYEHVLELNNDRGDVHNHMAEILWDQNQRERAIAEWKAAFAAFRRNEDGRIAESFWNDVRDTFENIGRRKLLAQTRAEADAVLRTYIRRSGNYRVEPLVDGALMAVSGSSEGVEWITDLSRVAPNPIEFLATAAESKRLSDAQREALYQRILLAATAKAAQPGPEFSGAQSLLSGWQLRWIGFLLDTKQTARAASALSALPESVRTASSTEVARYEMRIAALSKAVPQLLARYKADPDKAPSLDQLREFAGELKESGDPVARRILEYVYTQELERRNLTAANFLGLAEVRLADGDLPGAMALLRRMTLIVGEPFENLGPAAALLESTGHAAEARDFRAQRAKAVPWDLESRARMGDAAVARSQEATYAVRLDAARSKPGTNLGSAELDLLAGGAHPPIASVEKPYFYAARMAAAETAQAAAVRMRLLSAALAIDPKAAMQQRLPLFRAAVEAGNAPLALAIYQREVGYIPEAGDSDSESSPSYYSRSFLAGDYGTKDRAAIARALGSAFEKLGMPERAAVMYRIAVDVQPSAEVQTALTAVRNRLALRAANVKRRPAISAELAQDHLVLPRLTGGTSK